MKQAVLFRLSVAAATLGGVVLAAAAHPALLLAIEWIQKPGH